MTKLSLDTDYKLFSNSRLSESKNMYIFHFLSLHKSRLMNSPKGPCPSPCSAGFAALSPEYKEVLQSYPSRSQGGRPRKKL